MIYHFTLENAEANHAELDHLYRMHYAEMKVRLEGQGIPIAEYNPRVDEYAKASRAGYLLNFVVRTETGEPVGYCNLYLTNDMHNQELIAQEDTIYVRPEHRNGVGRKFSLRILQHLKERGVKRLNVVALTDLRVAKLWKRMGFREVGTAMTYIF